MEHNPGKGHTIRIAFANGERTWEESANLLDILAAVLQDEGHRATRHAEVLELPTGIVLRPQIVSVTPIHPVGAQTVTTVQVNHPRVFPAGVFEYQHASGGSAPEAATQGFQAWASIDLPALLDALEEKTRVCTGMEMGFPVAAVEDGQSRKTLQRRVIFGPPSHTVAHLADPSLNSGHAFCPCCLFTHSLDAFKELLETDQSYGLRLYAMRDQHGEPAADCRVNGEDWPAGQKALIAYVATWPDLGFEVRKQFVVIRTVAAAN